MSTLLGCASRRRRERDHHDRGDRGITCRSRWLTCLHVSPPPIKVLLVPLTLALFPPLRPPLLAARSRHTRQASIGLRFRTPSSLLSNVETDAASFPPCHVLRFLSSCPFEYLRELVLTDNEDGLEDLPSEDLGLDERDGLAVEADETLALLAVGDGGGRLLLAEARYEGADMMTVFCRCWWLVEGESAL